MVEKIGAALLYSLTFTSAIYYDKIRRRFKRYKLFLLFYKIIKFNLNYNVKVHNSAEAGLLI